jgi:predicted component of type VI protein secretion system
LDLNERKSRNLTFRARPELRDRLEAAARGDARSISEEIERRLERSFLEHHLMFDALELAYGTGLAGILLLVADAMRLAGASASSALTARPMGIEQWCDNPYAFDQAAQAASAIIEAFRPDGEPKAPPTKPPFTAAGIARGLLTNIALDEAPTGAPVARIRRALGVELVAKAKQVIMRELKS